MEDFIGIETVNKLAFGQSEESLLVEKLRENPEFISDLSIVASGNGKIILGHILFFPVKIVSETNSFNSLALAPMSVLPGFQNKGIGSKLVLYGLNRALEFGYNSVIVLGHTGYYPRFGFKPASIWNIRAPIEVPDDVFMAKELIEGALIGISGIVKYPGEFGI